MTATSLGQYELITRIAHGGMAEIYLAKRRGPGGFDKRVVIKRVLPHLCENHEFVQMFLDEARLASRLSHPNIVQIFDFGQIGETYYLCMEHLDGEDLSSVLRILRERSEPMPPQVAACLLSAACDGMHYAHTFHDEDGRDLKIVHRDLSPSNLFVTAQGAVKVLDFGIAKMEGKATQTQSGVVKGKFAYLSPEQANSEPVDARSDVYALGLILSEALTGVKVFKRVGEAATLRAVLTETVPSPRSLRPDLPRELERVVMKACARSPEDRWPSAQAMRAALDDYLANRASVPAASLLQTFMLGILGTERRGQGAPTPTASMLKAAALHQDYEHARTPSGALRLDQPRPGNPSTETQLGTPLPLKLRGPENTASAGTRVEGKTGSGPADSGEPAEAGGLGERGPSRGRRAPTAAYDLPPLSRPRRSILGVAATALVAAVAVGVWVLLPTGRADSTAGTLEQAAASAEASAQSPAAPLAPKGAGDSPAADGKPATGAVGDEAGVESGERGAGVAAVATEAAAKGASAAQMGQGLGLPRRHKRPRRHSVAAAAGRASRSTGPAEATKAVPGMGTLNVNCDPWCHVFVDGKDTGKNSPAAGMIYSAGKHRVKVRHEATGMTREKDVTLIAGKTATVRIRF